MIKKIPKRLREDEVDALVTRLKRGDSLARDALINSHVGLAVYIAGGYAEKTPELRDDIYSAALSCLVEKTERIREGKALNRDNNIGAYLNSSIVRAIHNVFDAENNRAKKHEAIVASIVSKEENVVHNEGPYRLILNEILTSNDFDEDEKMVISLIIDGYTVKEVSDQLETTPNRVKLMWSAMKERLQEYI